MSKYTQKNRFEDFTPFLGPYWKADN